MATFDIRLTDAAKQKAEEIRREGKNLRISIARSGCCSMAVTIYPDVTRVGDHAMVVDGITVLTRDSEYPELQWHGIIDYKEKGLRKGFIWK